MAVTDIMDIMELPYDMLRVIILKCFASDQARLMQTCKMFETLTLDLNPNISNIEECKKAVKNGRTLSVLRYTNGIKSANIYDNKLLYKSCQYGQLELVDYFFTNRSSYERCIFECFRGNNKWLADHINSTFNKGQIPTCYYHSNSLLGACHGGHLTLVNLVFLSAQMAKISFDVSIIKHAVRYAYRRGNVGIIQRLVKYGTFDNIDFSMEIACGIYKGGHIKLYNQFVSGLTQRQKISVDLNYAPLACRKGHLDFINQLSFTKHQAATTFHIRNEDSLLFYRCIGECVLQAITGNHLDILYEFRNILLEMFNAFISHGQDYVVSERINSYLMTSVTKGYLDMVKFVMELIRLSGISSFVYRSITRARDMAVSYGYMDIFEYLS